MIRVLNAHWYIRAKTRQMQKICQSEAFACFLHECTGGGALFNNACKNSEVSITFIPLCANIEHFLTFALVMYETFHLLLC